MDRASRIDQAFLEILKIEERILRQEERIASLDAGGMHGAAACAREMLILMADRLLIICDTHTTMVNTARVVKESRLAVWRPSLDSN